MSLLQDVIEQYVESSSEKPKAPTDKTAKTPFVSFGSEWSDLLENENGELTQQEIPTAKEMIAITQMREMGICPDHYTAETICKRCGIVPIWSGCPPQVDGCPWCFNRIKGLPVPGANTDG